MKRIFTIIFALIIMISLSGCMRFNVIYRPAYDLDEIESIALYNIGDNEYTDHIDNSYTPLMYLDESKYESFIEDLQLLPFEDFVLFFPVTYDPNFYYFDYVVMITYKNGSYETIAPDGVQDYYDENGIEHPSQYGCDNEEWNAFIQTYFEVEV